MTVQILVLLLLYKLPQIGFLFIRHVFLQVLASNIAN